MIKRDAAKLVLSSIACQTILGREYAAWDGFGDGWSPLGQPWNTFTELNIDPESILKRFPLSNRVRDGIGKCHFQYVGTRNDMLAKHAQNQLVLPSDLALWTDGSYQHRERKAASAALLYDNLDLIITQSSCRFNSAGSSYEPELQ
jgi:hypothetical protein